MKRLLLVIASVSFLLAACEGIKSSEDTSTGSSGDNSPTENLAVTTEDDYYKYKKITAAEAKQIIDDEASYVILDVRSAQEYSELRIDGSILIPHTEIDSRAQNELPDKDAIILVYCRSGVRSAAASDALAQMGYTNVYDFGGIISWPYETTSGISAGG